MNIERYNQSCKWTKEMADTYISENKDNGNDSDYTFAEWCYLRGAKDEHEKCMNETKMFIEKHSVEIGEKQGIRKFAEWLEENSYQYIDSFWQGQSIGKALDDYEKEQAKGGEND